MLREQKLCGVADLRVRSPDPKGACQTDTLDAPPGCGSAARAPGNRHSAGRSHPSPDVTTGHAGLRGQTPESLACDPSAVTAGS